LYFISKIGGKKLIKYDRSKLTRVKDIGSGSSGSVKLIYSEETKEYVVGKFFLCSGLQSKIKTQNKEAEREAKILAQLEHKNIVRVLGVTRWELFDKDVFVIILEYAPCGDLENLLMSKNDISLPWKLRARFFTELAGALDYLHNHDPKRSYIHGDLKPQNVLLGEKLEIKLADFGSATIAQITGATSLVITGEGNTQHTQFYTAPEFLKNPTNQKTKRMDVYSFGMIGYEILTRQVVYGGAPFDLVVDLIISKGQKPDIKCLHNVAESLQQNKNDLKIFRELEKLVKICWQTAPGDRPEISDVEKRLDELANSKLIYDKVTDGDIKKIIKKRELISELPLRIRRSNLKDKKQAKNWLLFIPAAMVIGLIASLIFLPATEKSFRNNNNKNASSLSFLVLDKLNLFKYEVESRTVTFLGSYTEQGILAEAYNPINKIVKVNNQVYIFTNFFLDPIGLITLGTSKLTRKNVTWNKRFFNRKYISSGNYLFFIGSLHFRAIINSIEGDLRPTAAADMYNTVTQRWTKLPDMNEPRVDHTLVLFQGLICAISGDFHSTAECFNLSTTKWTYLPKIIMSVYGIGKNPGAVELNGELYVIGGEVQTSTLIYNTWVVKYNPVKNSWSQVASLSSPRSGITSGVSNGKIYIIGGLNIPHVIEIYDPSKDKWEQENLLNFSTSAQYTVF